MSKRYAQQYYLETQARAGVLRALERDYPSVEKAVEDYVEKCEIPGLSKREILEHARDNALTEVAIALIKAEMFHRALAKEPSE